MVPRWAGLTLAGIIVVDVLVVVLILATAPSLAFVVLVALGALSLFP